MIIVDSSLQKSFETDLLEVRSIKSSLLSYQRFQFSLLDGFHKNVLFYAVLSNKTIYGDVSCLSNSMASILSLFIHGWVPVSIIKNDVTSSSKIKSNSSRARATNKAKYSWIIVKPLNNGLSEFSFGVAIKSNVIELEHVEDFLEYIKHFRHLSKYKYLLSAILDGSQQKYHLDQFTTVV